MMVLRQISGRYAGFDGPANATRHGWPALIAMVAWLSLASALGQADDGATDEHFNVETPANLSPAEAQSIYERVQEDMISAYGLSQDDQALRYQQWQRYNTAPYQSATHGSRYVSNYANGLARDYGRLGTMDALPKGSVLAKDSFAVTASGDVFIGPLFLMEKMEPGFSPEGRDWRYSMIMPDGSFFGQTGGDAEEQVTFCRTCHETAGDENDHLFYIPFSFTIPD